MRDKLIELIKSYEDHCDNGECPFNDLLERPCSLCATENIADHLIANGVGFIPYAPVVKIYKTWLERYDDALTLHVDFKIDDAMHHARLEITDEELSKFGYVRMPADVTNTNVGK